MGDEKKAWSLAEELEVIGNDLPGEVQLVSFKGAAPHWSNVLKWMGTYTKEYRQH